MRSLKGLLFTVSLFLFFRYFTAVYYAMEFNEFVEQKTQRSSQVTLQLQRELLDEAQLYFLPIKPDDIHINENDGLIRVKIDYKVPVNLFVFTHQLSFHAAGAGLAAR